MDMWRGTLNPDSLRELENLSKQLSNMVERRNVSRGDSQEAMASADWAPVVDIVESDSEFLLLAELPGVNKNEVKVSLEKGILTLTGQRGQDNEAKGLRHHRVERAYGKFARSFAVPESVDEQKLSAEFRDGLLKIHLPKAEKAKPRSVEIRVA
ncbi:MAG TPA: Hsp20/alpha crystallin family protein [Nitrospiraceae bacterium]|nr:Hsp20/alpha crystallin family protein [Nitrospiraceae bacterium]